MRIHTPTSAAMAPEPFVAALKAAAEPTRLRILVLLHAGEMNVTDFTRVLGQSQPRISRHLKLLVESGLVTRFQEGSWAYFRLNERGAAGALVERLIDSVNIDDPQFLRDRQRREALMQERVREAQAFFEAYAEEWDRIRALHIDDGAVEAAMVRHVGNGVCNLLVDIGTGTGRVLQLFAEHYERGLGIDINKTMLSYARAKLEADGIAHAQVRYGDLYGLNLEDASADIVVLHQVLHYLADPRAAIAEAVRVLRRGGRLLLVDFAPHGLEFLRERYAHVRLGFPAGEVESWLSEAGLVDVTTEHLQMQAMPDRAQQNLTVSLWTGLRRKVAKQRQTTTPQFERLGTAK